MRDRRIFDLKLAIEGDGKLSHGARTLGLRVGSYVYNEPNIWPEDSFPLPWTLASRLCWGMSKRECYRNVRELVDAGHLAYVGIKGCPGKAHFRMILADSRSAVAGNPRSVTVGKASGAICDNPRGAKNAAPLTNTLPSEEIVNSSGRNSSAKAAGEFNSSLRSAETIGVLTAASPEKRTQAEILAAGRKHIADFRKSQLAKPQAPATVASGSKSNGDGKLLRRKK